MGSPFTGLAGSLGHDSGFSVANTTELQPNPFTDEELQAVMDKLGSIGTLKAKNNNVIIFECNGMLLKVGKN
jgi:hypothetical protein